MNVCMSGGAEGADQAWGEVAKKNGHRVMHFVFDKHKGSDLEDAVIVSPEHLEVGDPVLKRANEEVLHRSFPAHSKYVTNLLRRNYWQVVETEAVYAVAGIDESGVVIGGTAWAVECFKIIQPHSDKIYVYDSRKDQWFQWSPDDRKWNEINKPPKPSGKWTGIGSRPQNLDEKGREAIERIFDDSL